MKMLLVTTTLKSRIGQIFDSGRIPDTVTIHKEGFITFNTIDEEPPQLLVEPITRSWIEQDVTCPFIIPKWLKMYKYLHHVQEQPVILQIEADGEGIHLIGIQAMF